jgi:hypothetical protein
VKKDWKKGDKVKFYLVMKYLVEEYLSKLEIKNIVLNENNYTKLLGEIKL